MDIDAKNEDIKDENEMLPGSNSVFKLGLIAKSLKDERILQDIELTTMFREEPGLYNQSLGLHAELLYEKKYWKVNFLFVLG